MNIVKCVISFSNTNYPIDIKSLITCYTKTNKATKLSVFNFPDNKIGLFTKDDSVYDYILFLSNIYENTIFTIEKIYSNKKVISIIINGEAQYNITKEVV